MAAKVGLIGKEGNQGLERCLEDMKKI